MKIRKAVIPVAGRGTRFLPASKVIPKEMIPVLDKPMVQMVVEEAVGAGIEQIVFVTASGKTAIEDHFDVFPELYDVLIKSGKKEIAEKILNLEKMIDVVGVRQKEQLGLGHAIHCACDVVGEETFAVLLPDDLYDAQPSALAQMVASHEKHPGGYGAVMEVPERDVSRYGVVVPTQKEVGGDPRCTELSGMVEKPPLDKAPSTLAIVGRYILPAQIFKILEGTQAGAIGEIQITDAIAKLPELGHKLYGYDIDGIRYDTGTPLGFVLANVHWGLQDGEMRDRLLQGMKKEIEARS